MACSLLNTTPENDFYLPGLAAGCQGKTSTCKAAKLVIQTNVRLCKCPAWMTVITKRLPVHYLWQEIAGQWLAFTTTESRNFASR